MTETSCSPPFFHGTVPVTANDRLACDNYLLRLEAPELGQAIRPGQFVMLRLPQTTDPLLGRPYALYDTVISHRRDVTGLDIVYLVVGKQTGRLAEFHAGDQLDLWGPLGQP